MKDNSLKMKSTLPYVGVLFLLIILGVAGRLLPHPPNFTPVAAIALFSGFFFSNRYVSYFAVLAIMAFTDLLIGLYEYKLMLVIYGAMLFPFVFRALLRSKLSAFRIGIATVSGSVFFFITTNFAVWLFADWYSKSFEGLIQCYIAGLPFFKNTLLGDFFWSGFIFGIYFLVRMYYRSTTPNQEVQGKLLATS